jgi:hypothetical protein
LLAGPAGGVVRIRATGEVRVKIGGLSRGGNFLTEEGDIIIKLARLSGLPGPGEVRNAQVQTRIILDGVDDSVGQPDQALEVRVLVERGRRPLIPAFKIFPGLPAFFLELLVQAPGLVLLGRRRRCPERLGDGPAQDEKTESLA